MKNNQAIIPRAQNHFFMCEAQLTEKKTFTFSEIWSLVRPAGICVTSESTQEYNDGIMGDLRVLNIGGPEKMHNIFGKDVELGGQWGVLFQPVKCPKGTKFHFRLSSEGKLQQVECKEESETGFIWQLEFYSAPGVPQLDKYSTILETGEKNRGKMITGGYMRLGRIHYDFTEAPLDYFAKNKNPDINCSLGSTDMVYSSKTPIIDVFWDPVQKCY